MEELKKNSGGKKPSKVTFKKCLTLISLQCAVFSCVRLFATPWTVDGQALLSMGFSRQEYWSALPFPSPGDLPNPGIELRSLTLQADSLPSEPLGKFYCRTIA